MRILAIDPGYERIGIAILDKQQPRDILVYSECFKTSARDAFEKRLCDIGLKISSIIDAFSPEVLAIETLFLNTNQKTAMRVSEARGVIIYEAAKRTLRVEEFTPLEIKVATLGYGRGDKKSIMSMVPKLVTIKKAIKHDDEFDAIAAGITCSAHNRIGRLR
ncbi:MAG TPA: crossover junction endodeoxyribonuclease RuvC [Candidatus Paceibacterota bacterium]